MSEKVAGRELAQWRNWAFQLAIAAQIPTQEVDWLLCEIAGLTKLELRLESYQGREITLKYSLDELTRLWQKRVQELVPVQYLAQVAPWRDFSLKVTPYVLIPRPETEYIIDIALKALSQSSVPNLASGNWVDLGTGSGAIAIGLAKSLTKATIYATDLSEQALEVARENANQLGLQERIKFYQGSWWSPIEFLKGKVSGIVSNPPYIPTGLIQDLQPEVARHEPHLALDGGEDGLDCLRYLIETSPDYLCAGGIWLVEMMAGQGEIVAQMLAQQGSYENIEIIADLAGIQRFCLATRK